MSFCFTFLVMSQEIETIHNNKLFANSFKVILVIGNRQTLSE
ncbi:hypothetical protein GARC_0664 [Paraglaciecola arctica BSs20135]|uniref:Uncharacterized protein n=1 Tax=Paraglaciecola arctica BSs20135 TaxID=493475 RepID=K6Z2F7_9ALTE|nr:hypothetical protein GARC_0664 [Paraglaciecola arctica BSs20135]